MTVATVDLQHVMKKPAMSKYTIFRTVVYSVFMVLTMALTAFYALTLLLYDPWFITFSGIVSLSFAFLSFVWISVMLGFNNRPFSQHRITHARTHFASFIIFAVFWFASAFMSTISATMICSGAHPWILTSFWCPFGALEVVLSWILAITSVCMAFVIHKRAKRFGTGLDGNIAQTSNNHFTLDAFMTSKTSTPGLMKEAA